MTNQIDTQLSTTPDSLTARAEAAGLVLRHVYQPSLNLYEVYTATGEFLHLSLTEQLDNPTRWRNRSEAERDAMMTLALDEYYGKLTWDEAVIQIEVDN